MNGQSFPFPDPVKSGRKFQVTDADGIEILFHCSMHLRRRPVSLISFYNNTSHA